MTSNKSGTRVKQLKFFMIFDAVSLVGTKFLFRFNVICDDYVLLSQKSMSLSEKIVIKTLSRT